jgi:hypothetical protein
MKPEDVRITRQTDDSSYGGRSVWCISSIGCIASWSIVVVTANFLQLKDKDAK